VRTSWTSFHPFNFSSFFPPSTLPFFAFPCPHPSVGAPLASLSSKSTFYAPPFPFPPPLSAFMCPDCTPPTPNPFAPYGGFPLYAAFPKGTVLGLHFLVAVFFHVYFPTRMLRSSFFPLLMFPCLSPRLTPFALEGAGALARSVVSPPSFPVS